MIKPSDEVTANIKTFLRPDKYDICLKSCINAGIKNIVVGYDGPNELEEEHKRITDSYRDSNKDIDIIFNTYEYDYGISAVRNRMVKKTETDYILQLDDDNYPSPWVLNSVYPLVKYHNLYGIGLGWFTKDNIYIDGHDFEIVNNYYVRLVRDKNKYTFPYMGHFYVFPFDFIPNSVIFKKSLFDIIKWDENYKINREHEDFYLQVKNYNSEQKTQGEKLQFGIDFSTFIYHDFGGDKNFLKLRRGIEYNNSIRYFRKKWNLKGIVGRAFTNCLDYGQWKQIMNMNNEHYIDMAMKDEVDEKLIDDVDIR